MSTDENPMFPESSPSNDEPGPDQPKPAESVSADERLAAVLAEAITTRTDELALDNLHADWARVSVGRSLAAVLRDAGWVHRDEVRESIAREIEAAAANVEHGYEMPMFADAALIARGVE